MIAGQVISSDRSGNIYRELYIQDETGAIDVKIGKSSLYSDYHLGQWVYVDCNGLMIGSYSGMPQLGVEDETGEAKELFSPLMADGAVFEPGVVYKVTNINGGIVLTSL